jgi:hypothetical protein
MFEFHPSYTVAQQCHHVTSTDTVTPIDVDIGVLPPIRAVFLRSRCAQASYLEGARFQSRSRADILTERLFGGFLGVSRGKYREYLPSRFRHIHHLFIVLPFEVRYRERRK